ncbi:MAG: hypothetical protein M1833_002320 [Piccolia ochrophora]|nr:MAG: hypothetical protein M1833_002320 [Piccolia ochrophora]
MATQFDDFAMGENRDGSTWPLLGSGIFTQNGRAWEHSRAMLRPHFAREQISDLDMEERHVQNLMNAIPIHDSGWTDMIDVQKLFFRLSIDSATEFLFGESVDSQVTGLRRRESPLEKRCVTDEATFAEAFDLAQKWVAKRFRSQDLHPLCTSADFRKACRHTHDFVDHFVQLALSKDMKQDDIESEGKSKTVFLDALVTRTRDPIELRSQLLHVLLAGRDTTASLLGWLFLLLARHQDVFHKLRSSVLETFGPYDDPHDLTFAGLKSCQYLQRCLKEVLRVLIVVPFNNRAATRDTTLPRGGGPDGQSPIFLAKGQTVDFSVFVMHHRTDLWGDDAEQFRPERWEGLKPGWEYLPFGGGARICLGQQLLLTETSYVTVRLLQRFDVIEDPEMLPIKYDQAITMCSGNGTRVRMHQAATG